MEQPSYLDKLNPQQREAVQTLDGPVLIVAGAGSGKTRVLTYRIAYLLQHQVKPYAILALTFTNKAAQEMKERIEQIVGSELASKLTMGTFHSIFMRILKDEASAIGYESNFTIFDTSDSQSAVNRIIKALELDSKIYDSRKLFAKISSLKNHLISSSEFRSKASFYSQRFGIDSQWEKFGEIYERYCAVMLENNAMDFDDLLINTHRLFHEHPDILERYQNIYQYILVDEYQDTNAVQNEILNLLARRFRNLCVVGDDAQSIYAFRGANMGHILNFTKQYPETKTIKLITNYRSTPPIVNAANELISHNEEQIRKVCRAAQTSGEKIDLMIPYNEGDEANRVALKIRDIVARNQCDYGHFAVLYRTSSQSRKLEEMLHRYNIPYTVYGGLSFFKRKEIQDFIAYCKFLINPRDTESLLRIINFPKRGIGDKAQEVLLTEAAAKHLHLWNYIETLSAQSESSLQKSALTAICLFREQLQPLMQEIISTPANEMAQRLYEASGLAAYYQAESAESIEGEARQGNLQEFLHAVDEFVKSKQQQSAEEVITLGAYIDEAALQTETDQEKNVEACVTLSTVHSSKGLEFDHVFVVGLEDGLFPSKRSKEEDGGLEEERRLCYVAVTRAAQTLTLSSCQSRFFAGHEETSKPSIFIEELLGEERCNKVFSRARTGGNPVEDYSERSLVRGSNSMRSTGYGGRKISTQNIYTSTTNRSPRFNTRAVPPPQPKPQGGNTSSSKPFDSLLGFAVGDKVRHPERGIGTIVEIASQGLHGKVYIRFTNTGRTEAMYLAYAQLEKLDS